MGDNYVTCQTEKGSINISEEVITSIVKSALGEIDGVAGLSLSRLYTAATSSTWRARSRRRS